VRRVAGAFRISGEGFALDAACGLAVMPEEAATATDALRLADGRMYVRKESGRPSTVRSARDVLVRALHEREPELGAHIRGVADLSTAVGRRLRLASEALEVLGRAAELHDVGKLAMPDHLLGKPGELDAGEWELMRRHPEIGARILAPVAALAPVAELVAASHERWDGTGYPAGLAGDEIPLGARIIAVCDVYDAMVSDLPYAAARPVDEALAEIRAGAGTLFDPAVVEAFAAEVGVAR
jgi:two-component system, cell cycle response regulator